MGTKSLRAATAVAALLLAATQLSAAELVTNGDFETGDLSGWTQGGNTDFTGVGTGALTNFSAYLGPVGSIGTLSQTLATVVGATYTFSFDVSGDKGFGTFSALLNGESLVDLATSKFAAMGATTISGEFVADSASTILSFNFRQDPAFWHLDNVSVQGEAVAVPGPEAGAGLGALALGGMALLMKRRRKDETLAA